MIASGMGAHGALTPEQAVHLTAALSRGDLTPKARAFLNDVRDKARRWPLSPKQAQVVRRMAEAPPRPDYVAINAAALARLPDVLTRLLPGGRVVRGEYECANLHGGEGTSMRINMTRGVWCDFATGDRGGNPVSLAAAVTGKPPAEAAHGLARMLGMEGVAHG